MLASNLIYLVAKSIVKSNSNVSLLTHHKMKYENFLFAPEKLSVRYANQKQLAL
jgi:hypothetical protein